MDRNKRNECYYCAHKRNIPGNAHIKCVNPDEKMVGNPHGIANGWFWYPLLFDPTWKESMCRNFSMHEQVKNSVNESVSRSVSVADKSK